MANPVEGAKDLLVAAGVGVFGATTGWGIYVGKQPEAPDTIVTVYNSPGNSPFARYLLDFPGIQVRVRGAKNKYSEAYSKAVEVKNALHSLPSQDILGDRWVSVQQAGDIAPLGFDENDRPMFSLNFNLIVEPASGTHRVPL